MSKRIRDYFAVNDVLEVDTPALSTFAASDTQIESFEIPSSQVGTQPMFLHTSPEFCMKRLLCAGYPDIFSICRVFRDGESGRRHQPEFTMVEWYRLGFGLDAMIEDTLNMIHAALTGGIVGQEALRFDYRHHFLETVGIDPLTASIEALADAAGADDTLRQSIGDERNDWLDLLLATRIAPTFDTHRLTVLRHYPASQAALARLCPHNPQVADRFEVFFGTSELANGYVELSDAREQANRMQQDNQERHRRGRKVRPRDVSLLAALEHGLPACAGVAVGLERLQMIYSGSNDIHDVLTFPFAAAQ